MTVAQGVMQSLYGADLWSGFVPARPLEPVLGWHGKHPLLTKLAPQASPPVVIDVGVWKGQSTIHLASVMNAAGVDGCVVAVDTFLGSSEHWTATGPKSDLSNPTYVFSRRHGMPDLYEQFMCNVWHAGVAANVVPLPQTSTTAAMILRRFKISAGMIHIDASHTYDDVVKDIAAYWPLLARGGYFVGDDYNWEGVTKAANEFAERIGIPLTIDGAKWWVRKP